MDLLYIITAIFIFAVTFTIWLAHHNGVLAWAQ